ncbi:MAG: 16S rRNA (guanine(966)-N(2))-methyltransferase RsmD [Deltaproteobacteria bacterium]|nr:16S rRNA (guanine(966)-N(2))-methyltransferase RsmD [Deltaproteobacteria bacterium]
MRVIGGELRGRKLLAPRGGRIRPTSDRVREAIFDILGLEWVYHKVLDLFAGTGALGIEALSRGAQEATFVEQGKEALKTLQGNLEDLRLTSRARVLPRAAKKGIKILSEGREVFDLIFVDPPYGKDMVGKTLQEIAQRGILSPRGVIVAEHSPHESIPLPIGMGLFKQKRYGDTAISFFQWVSSSP